MFGPWHDRASRSRRSATRARDRLDLSLGRRIRSTTRIIWRTRVKLSGLVKGNAFPLVGAAVADTPPSAGSSPQRPFESERAEGFAVTGLRLEERPPAPVMEIGPMNMQVLDAPRDISGGYKVDVSRGERIGRVSSEWFSPIAAGPAWWKAPLSMSRRTVATRSGWR